jgi:hypothetical protein
MPATRAQIEERVFREIAGSASEERAGFTFADIRAMMLTACATLAGQLVNAPESFRHYLTKTYTVTPVAGIFSLSGAGLSDCKIESLPRATLTHADSIYPLSYVGTPESLYFPHYGQDLIYYAIDGRNIRTRFADQVDSLTTDLTIRNAVFEPVIADVANNTTLPDVLEDDIVQIIKGMVQQKLQARAGGGAGVPQQ